MRIPLVVIGLALALLPGCSSHNTAQKGGSPFGSGEPVSQPTYRGYYPYTKPLTSPGGKFGMLPPVVQNTVRAEAGAAEVVDAVRDTRAGRVVYIIYFRDPKSSPPLYVAPDGTVLYPDLSVAVNPLLGTVVKPERVPASVMSVVLLRAPGADIAVINKELWGSRVVYSFTFKEAAKNPRLDVSEEGTIMDEMPPQ